jgi:hypothetical protein
MQSKLVVLCAVAILGLSSPAVAKGGGGGGGKGGSSHVECMVMVTSTMVNSVIVS